MSGKCLFISYAKEDTVKANQLFNDLQSVGNLFPWLDTENLKAGQNWKTEIKKAIQKSDFFIALLSKHSVSKKGVVQKELNIAIDHQENISEKDIYIVPVRIDKCIIPDSLADIHCIDLFPDYQKGFNQIMNSIKAMPNIFSIQKTNQFDQKDKFSLLLTKNDQCQQKFQRSDTVNQLISNIQNNSSNVFIVSGQRMTGKTRLLNQINKAFLNAPPSQHFKIPLHISFRSLIDTVNFSDFFCRQIERAYNDFMADYKYYKYYIEWSPPFFENISMTNFFDTFWEALKQTAVGSPLLILIDDFETIFDLNETYCNEVLTFFNNWKNMYELSAPTTFLLSICDNPSRPPIKKFTECFYEYVPYKVSYFQNVIQTIVSVYPNYKLSESLIKYFELYFDGHPRLIILMYDLIEKYLHEGKCITEEMFEIILNKAANLGDLAIQVLWDDLSRSEQIVLQLISDKYSPFSSLNEIIFTKADLIERSKCIDQMTLALDDKVVYSGLMQLKKREWIILKADETWKFIKNAIILYWHSFKIGIG